MFLFVSLNDLIDGVDFNLLEFFSVEVVNVFVELPHGLSQLGVEVILHTVVGSAWHSIGYNSPFIPNLVVKSEKLFLVFSIPGSLHIDRLDA